MNSPIDSHCARCLQPVDPDGNDWEALGEDGSLVVCEDCITPEEQQTMDEADMEAVDKIESGEWVD